MLTMLSVKPISVDMKAVVLVLDEQSQVNVSTADKRWVYMPDEEMRRIRLKICRLS